jgi:hypothetical protein
MMLAVYDGIDECSTEMVTSLGYQAANRFEPMLRT